MGRIALLIIFLSLSAFTQMTPDPKIISSLKGFRIDLVAPASGTSQEELQNIKELGLKLKIPAECLDLTENKVLFCAHDDNMRFKCLKEALLAKNNNIIWTLRGGYGAARIVENLFDLQKPAKAKIVIGYSDITALHLFLSQEWGWQTIHGAVLTELLKPEKSGNNFVKIADFLSGRVNSLSIDQLKPLNKSASESSAVEGLITGGNLTIIETSIGTKWQIKTKDKIVFLEDVGVKPYQIDRTLLHLMQAGVFKDIKAIIFGSFSGDDELTLKTLSIFAQNMQVPVYHATKFGHNKFNYPIIYNSKAKIIKSDDECSELTMTP
jgi:muramoyltetrapeptide carboxypeptidase